MRGIKTMLTGMLITISVLMAVVINPAYGEMTISLILAIYGLVLFVIGWFVEDY